MYNPSLPQNQNNVNLSNHNINPSSDGPNDSANDDQTQSNYHNGNGGGPPDANLPPDNLDDAHHFLEALAPGVTEFTFQVFIDDKNAVDRNPRIFHGSLSELSSKLARLNKKGYGIYVCINETDLQGRKNRNITKVRAAWADNDKGFNGEYPLVPSMIVETSPGKSHDYFFTDTDKVDELPAVLERLVQDYRADPNAKGINRVMRLPGFLHQKDPQKSYMVKVTHLNEHLRYSWDEIISAFPPVTAAKSRLQGGATRGTVDYPKPTQFFNYARVCSALTCIDPDSEYGTWLEIGMALHSATNGSWDGQMCFEFWSAGGFHDDKPQKFNHGECEQKWRSFNSGSDIKIGTLFDHAKKIGWNGWYKSDHGKIQDWVSHDRVINLELFNKLHGVIIIKSKTMIARNVPGIQGGVEREFMSVSDARTFYKNLKIPVVRQHGDIGEEDLFDIWLKSATRRQYQFGARFKPIAGLVADNSLVLPGHIGGFLELYTGLAIAPVEGDCHLILDHIRLYWCHDNSDSYKYIMSWLARMFQCPDKQGETAIVLKSGEGTGKNIITDIIDEAFGIHGLTMTKSDDVTGRFNDHLATSVFVCLNEAVWGGDKNRQGTLKSLITDKTILCERKYVPKFSVPNCTHLMLLSNNEWVAPAGMDDRRYFFLDVSEEKKQDQEYFTHLVDQIENGGREAFVHYLLHYDISEFNPRVMPKSQSETRKDNKLRTASSVHQWWDDVLDNGYIENPEDDYPEFISQDDWKKEIDFIATAKLHNHYLKWCGGHRVNHPEAKGSFSKTLNEILGGNCHRKTTDKRGFKLPAIKMCRSMWANMLAK